jgi:hypothetical protein
MTQSSRAGPSVRLRFSLPNGQEYREALGLIGAAISQPVAKAPLRVQPDLLLERAVGLGQACDAGLDLLRCDA